MLIIPNPNFTTVFDNKRYSLHSWRLMPFPISPLKFRWHLSLFHQKRDYFSLLFTSWEFEIYLFFPLIKDEAAFRWQTLPVKLVPF